MNVPLLKIIVAPILSDGSTLVIYRDSGEEIIVKINKLNKSMTSIIKLKEQEFDFIKENYL